MFAPPLITDVVVTSRRALDELGAGYDSSRDTLRSCEKIPDTTGFSRVVLSISTYAWEAQEFLDTTDFSRVELQL